jgi:HD-GYP domain-containing protein (c-di-GMP phosphodiesterase class II)
MLHDIGKVAIDDRILKKPGKLDDDEWIVMKTHSEIGFRIASAASELDHIADYILTHHERWDGKGYPQGLAGEAILFFHESWR